MAFRTKKISQMDPKGSNLASTDLLEISELVSGSYVTKSITGAEIIASVPPTTVDWGDIGGTLSAQTDLNTALSGKQDDITLTTTGTSGASTFVANTLNVPAYSLSGLGGVPTSRTLTINGTTQDLSADRTFTISTGITIGTTAITSGTVGRVLFEGTGNVVQESANLFWDNTNGRLGVGTSTPASRFQITESITTTANDYSAITFDGTITSRATASDTFYGFRIIPNVIATAANQRIIGIDLTPNTTFFNSTTNYIGLKIGGLANSQDNGTAIWAIQKSTAGNNGFAINPANNRWEMGFISSSTSTIITGPKITMHSTGILIGPSGNPDGRLQIGGLGATSTTKTFIARNSASTDLFTIWDDGAIGVNTATNAGFKLDVNGTARVSGNVELPSFSLILRAGVSGYAGAGNVLLGNNSNIRSMNPFNSGTVNLIKLNGSGYIEIGGGNNSGTIINPLGEAIVIGDSTFVSSSICTINSTNRGFLPPRMTSAQRTAIASPATGLVVYQTDGTEGLYINKSTGWALLL